VSLSLCEVCIMNAGSECALILTLLITNFDRQCKFLIFISHVVCIKQNVLKCVFFVTNMLLHALIFQKQARRVYEILRLRMTDIHNSEQYRRYRLDVKNRLNVPYQVRGHKKQRVQFVRLH